MNNNGTTIFIGALIGASLGYLIGDWYIETYIPEEEFELDEPKDQITKFEERLSKQQKPLATFNMNRAANGVGPIRDYTEFFQKENRPELAKLAAKYNGLDDKVMNGDQEAEDPEGILDLGELGLSTDIEEDNDETEEMLDDGNDPGIIRVDVYAADEEHSHTTLHYYTDDVLTDEGGVPVNRPERFLPENALVSFGEMSGDEDIVYIRNSQKKAMYEIVRMDRPYAGSDQGRVRRSNKKDYVNAKKEMGNVTGEDD